MPKKISLIEKREWLQLYESGTPEAAIAAKSNRGLKTIKSGIEDARKERDARLVRSGLLRDAIRNHQNQLMDVIKSTLSVLKLPPVDIKLELPVVVPGPGPMDGRAEWELLKAHLGKSDALWTSLDLWKKVIIDHILARSALKDKVGTLIKSRTEYQLVNGPTNPPYIYSLTAITTLYTEALNLALGVTLRTSLEKYIGIDTESGEVRYEQDHILAKAPGEEEQCMRNILSAFTDLNQSTEMNRVIQTYKKVKDTLIKARSTTEEIVMMGIIPGRCRVCKRLGM